MTIIKGTKTAYAFNTEDFKKNPAMFLNQLNEMVSNIYDDIKRLDSKSLWEVDGTETQLKTADEIDLQSKKMINGLDPTANQDIATKKYHDDNKATAALFKMATFTRDITAATGSQEITGVGFQPTRLIVIYGVDSTPSGGIGFVTSALDTTLWNSGGDSGTTGNWSSTLTRWINCLTGVGAGQFSSTSPTLGSDGFTIPWTKQGSPGAGTINCTYFAIKDGS